MLLALLLTTLAAAPPSVEAAAARFGPTLVTVRWHEGEASAGFFVSSSGTLATVLPKGVAEVVVEVASGERRPGRLLARDVDGLALVALATGPNDALLPALAVVEEDRALPPEVWLLGMGTFDGRASPSLGGLRRVDARGRWRLDLPVDRGAPVLHEGRVVAVVLARDGRTAAIAVPAAVRLRALAAQVARP